MTRELSRREVRLLLVLPALLIAIAYLFLFEQSNQAALRRLQKSLETAQHHPVSPVRLATARHAVQTLEAQVSAEKRPGTADAQLALKMPSRWTTPAGRLDALATIASVFDAHALAVVDTSRQADSEARGVVPLPLQDFANAVVHDGHHPVPQLWRVEAVGSYVDLLAALEELGRRDAFIVPLAVSMQTLPQDSAKRRWSLWLWV